MEWRRLKEMNYGFHEKGKTDKAVFIYRAMANSNLVAGYISVMRGAFMCLWGD